MTHPPPHARKEPPLLHHTHTCRKAFSISSSSSLYAPCISSNCRLMYCSSVSMSSAWRLSVLTNSSSFFLSSPLMSVQVACGVMETRVEVTETNPRWIRFPIYFLLWTGSPAAPHSIPEMSLSLELMILSQACLCFSISS